MRARALVRALALALAGVLLVALAGCGPKRLPPGNELEFEEGQDPEARKEAELSAAFDPPPATAEEAATPVELDPFADPGDDVQVDGPDAPEPEPPSDPEDPRAAERARFSSRLAAARRALAAGDFDDVDAAAQELQRDVDLVGPPAHQQLAELSFKTAMARKQGKGAKQAAERWLLSCGPERVGSCRARALAALGTISRARLPESAAARERQQLIERQDQCVAQAEAAARAKSPLPSCVDEATAMYRRMNDRLMLARVSLARGLVAAPNDDRAGEAVNHLTRASKACEDARCASVRRQAFRSLTTLHLRLNNPEAATRAALAESRLAAESAAPSRRAYVRPPLVDRTCAVYDAKAGPGACRKLEKELFGDWSFRDFSESKAKGGLPPTVVKQVYDHYGVTLQECLASEAERLVPPAILQIEVRWMVKNDGRVSQVRMGRKDQEQTPLSDCMRRQLEVWRYPRYDGENQHVEQRFTVSARQRR